MALVLLLGCKSTQQASAVSFTQPNKTYNITSTVTGNVNVGDNSTLVFSGKGQMKDAVVRGRNIKVVAKSTGTIFTRCNFSNATFASTSLAATNFGMVSGMKTRPLTSTVKGYTFKTQERYGTDNTAQLEMLAQFLSGGNNIKINVNGSFYSGTKTSFIKVKDATNIEIYGPGTLIMGLAFYDCANCSFHDLNFVGYHTVHDFPPVWYYKVGEVNGVTYTKETAFNAAWNKPSTIGLAWEAIQILPTKTNPNVNRNFSAQRIHMEMRRNGFCAGVRSSKLVVRNISVDNVTFDHIYYQPVGLHVTGGTVNNVRGKYCLQGVDLSAGTNNVTVANSKFEDCAFGPKQESIDSLRSMSHHNVIDGCTFGINDKYFMIDAAQYILNVAQGPAGDTFTVRNTTFNVKKNRTVSGVMTRAYRCLLENVTFNIDAPLDRRSTKKFSVYQLFSVYGETPFDPQLELNNVTVNFGRGTTVQYLATPGLKKPFHIKARNLTVNGAGSLDNYFVSMESVDLQAGTLNMKSNAVASNVNTLKLSRVNAAATGNFVVNSQANATVDVANCSATAGSMVKCQAMPKSLNLTDNSFTITGSQAVSGVNASQVNANRVKMSGNTFRSQGNAVKIMDNAALKKLPAVSRSNSVR